MPHPYGRAHRTRRAKLLPLAYGQLCPMCGEVMAEGQDLELDHSTPLALDMDSVGDRIVHGSCNSRAGQRLGSRRKGKPYREPRNSREW